MTVGASSQLLTAPAEPAAADAVRRRSGKVRDERVTLAHGGGGKAMRDLIDDVIVAGFDNALLAPLEDQARIALSPLNLLGDRLAFTTDSYVVDPLFFPGGDIGSLAVNGTVNDLAVSGARPLYLSCGFILEEGLEIATLRRVVASMAAAAAAAGVYIVTGDTKVVPRGAADKLYVNTAGIGVIGRGIAIEARRATPGDSVILSGTIGDHGATVLQAREDLALDADLRSDCQPLHGLVAALLAACPDVHCLRDATRGGVATVLNEFALAAGVGLLIDESTLPVRAEVRGVCELLGLDALYMANEGKLLAVVPPQREAAALAALRSHPAGRDAAVIGRIRAAPPGCVVMSTMFGGERIVDLLVGDQLPRIC